MSNVFKIRNSNNYFNQTCPKTKKIREIFNLDNKVESNPKKLQNKKTYNEELFFKDSGISNRDQISNIINDVISKNSISLNKESIKFKVNINNNFYDSNIGYIFTDKEKGSSSTHTSKNENISEEPSLIKSFISKSFHYS